MSEAGKRLDIASSGGSYADNVRARAGLAKSYLVRSSGLAGPLNLVSHAYFALFLLGLYAGRKRILQDVGAHQPLLRTVALAGLLIGVPLSMLLNSPWWAPAWLPTPIPGTGADYGSVLSAASQYLLACGYACALLLVLAHETWRGRMRWLAPVGRMGLTNYVVQGVFLTTLNNAYGFGLHGQLGSLAWMLIAIAIFGIQVVYSNWWLSHFQLGPLEWLWRKLTNWQPLKMVRASPVAST